MIKRYWKDGDTILFEAIAENGNYYFDKQGVRYDKAFVSFPTEEQVKKYLEAEDEYENLIAISMTDNDQKRKEED